MNILFLFLSIINYDYHIPYETKLIRNVKQSSCFTQKLDVAALLEIREVDGKDIILYNGATFWHVATVETQEEIFLVGRKSFGEYGSATIKINIIFPLKKIVGELYYDYGQCLDTYDIKEL